MKTAMYLYRPNQPVVTTSVEFKTDHPSGPELKAVVEPLLDGAKMEHVVVLWKGRRADMFVDEEGVQKRLLRNEEATAIYRASWMSRFPDSDPEDLPYIYGNAVLFEEVVWK